jgi:hypothetical protein
MAARERAATVLYYEAKTLLVVDVDAEIALAALDLHLFGRKVLAILFHHCRRLLCAIDE